MKNITGDLGTLYKPVKAFLIYQNESTDKSIYIESYDMDSRGYPANAHPLSIRECQSLANALKYSEDMMQSFLQPEGLLPKNVLYINADYNGYAVWYTPPRSENLIFLDTLGIPDGKANVPAMVWKATKEKLSVYALNSAKDRNAGTELFHAPFFNVYAEGKVCMGSVAVNIPNDCNLEAFMALWESYFFNSYFSHLFQGHAPVKGNIVQLWQSLINTQKKFPVKTLIKNGLTLKNIIQ